MTQETGTSDMRIHEKLIMLVAVVAVLLLSPNRLYAQRRVIDEANIEEQDGCAVIMVQFDFPVRYRSHFPKDAGTELRIQFEPISMGTSDIEGQFEREQVWYSPNDIIPLTEAVFEGNIAGGPFLTLTFEHSVYFEVEPGADFRSLVVTPFQDKERAECFPTD